MDLGDYFYFDSTTSGEESGNDVYRNAREILEFNDILYSKYRSKQLTNSDYDNFAQFL